MNLSTCPSETASAVGCGKRGRLGERELKGGPRACFGNQLCTDVLLFFHPSPAMTTRMDACDLIQEIRATLRRNVLCSDWLLCLVVLRSSVYIQSSSRQVAAALSLLTYALCRQHTEPCFTKPLN